MFDPEKYIGRVYGKLKIIGTVKGCSHLVRVSCNCSIKIHTVKIEDLVRGHKYTCGCGYTSARDLEKGYNPLLAIRDNQKPLVGGIAQLRKERREERQLSGEYNLNTMALIKTHWKDMIDKCEQPRNPHYDKYGAKGATVSEKWYNFEIFCDDMLSSYKNHWKIRRKNPDLPFSSGNSFWLPKRFNNKEVKDDMTATLEGQLCSYYEIAYHLGWSENWIIKKIHEGYTDFSYTLDRKEYYVNPKFNQVVKVDGVLLRLEEAIGVLGCSREILLKLIESSEEVPTVNKAKIRMMKDKE